MPLRIGKEYSAVGWEIKNLGDICENLDSKRVPVTQSSRKAGSIPYYGASGIVDYVADYIFDEDLLLVSEDGANLLARTYPIAFSITGKAWVNNHAHVLRFAEKTTQSFVEYYLNSISLEPYVSGMAQPKLNQKSLNSINIPIPPLPEQKRIVSIVDEAFEGIDRAIANTQKNLTNARELFESYLNAIFTQKGDGWVEKKLDEIGGKVFTGPFGSLLHKADYIPNGIPIVNPANIEDGEIVPNFNKTVSQDVIIRLQAYVLSQNDIVIGRRGEIGRCAVVREDQAGWLCGSGSFFIKTFENVDSVFLTHLFRSAHYRNQLEALSAGATMQNLSNQALSGLLIAMPPLDEQNRITDKLDDLKTETKRIETIYRRKLAALTELKQAILQKGLHRRTHRRHH